MKPGHVIHRFLEMADAFPDQVAVRFHENGHWQQVTYRELRHDASEIARQLLDLGLEPGHAVVLPSQRFPRLGSYLLGILWAGGHYVFMDVDYPLERQQLLCEVTGAKWGLRPEGFVPPTRLELEWVEAGIISETETAPPIPDNPDLPAYVMFTSGSTGTPKGVVVPHRAIHRLVVDTDYISFGENEVFLQLSALSFDASTLEIWGPLLNGGTCVLHPESETLTPRAISSTIATQGVTTAWLTSSLYNTFISDHSDLLKPLKQLLIGGEALSVPHVVRGLKELSQTALYNGYGPTENTTFTTVFPIPRDFPESASQVPIGYPIKGTRCEIFDTEGQPITEPGLEGELVVFGEGVALGYLNGGDLGQDKFMEWTDPDGILRKGYRTGDIVARNRAGYYAFVGRNDRQVKIDGHRIEPGEIERFLNQVDGISDVRVVVKLSPTGQKRLAAYLVGNGWDQATLREMLLSHFPDFMVPHFFVTLDALPKTKNGKLDESQLPDPFASLAPKKYKNAEIASCWTEVLGRAVPENQNFLEAGGTSLEALSLVTTLEKRFGLELSATFVFEYPTIKSMAQFFKSAQVQQERSHPHVDQRGTGSGFAIIGMAGRFPGADDIGEYWDNLLAGRETVSFFSDEELSDEVDPRERQHSSYVKAKGIINDVDSFDASFFGISPIEAKVMDPQQRIMLELSWHALEDAGIPPGDQDLRTGVFMGMNWARYYQQYVLPNKELIERFGKLNSGLANEPDLLSTRISYKLNLKGPSLNIFTACSTGLVAVAQACEAIEQGQCELALAGGASVATPIKSGYLYQEGSMLSKDGHCRPFDVDARGTTFNDGAGVVVIKRLDLAQQDGDRIYAVIKGYAVNNDGEQKASFTAPSVGGQVAVYNAALDRAGIDPATVGFIETHGTATPLGDPIEVRSLSQSYAATRRREKTCVLGSVKSNIGHTIHAAGVASLIKTALAVKNNAIPPTLFFNEPNPKLELDKTHFFVNTSVVPFSTGSPRRAAVSSLGVGGTNAHVLVEEYVDDDLYASMSPEPDSSDRLGFPLLISSKTKEGLDRQIASYAGFVDRAAQNESLVDISLTTLTGRRHFDHRAMVAGRSWSEITEQLGSKGRMIRGQAAGGEDGRIGFMFSGQGAQRINMGRWLYEVDSEYRETMERGCRIVLEKEGLDLAKILYPAGDSPEDQQAINQTRAAQPALFLTEYALARFLEGQGCSADFYIGHSIGEFPAAALAGVFSFEDAVALVARRGALMQSMPPGKMLAVRASLSEVEKYVAGDINLAANNAPNLTVLTGPEPAVVKLAEELTTAGIKSTVLQTSHAFHSHMMDPIVGEFEEYVGKLVRGTPTLPIFSTMTGRLMTPEEATSPQYWAAQLRNPVQFSRAVMAALEAELDHKTAFIEVGPGGTLATLASCHDLGAGITTPLLPGFGIDAQAAQDIDQGLGLLWVHGFDVDWIRKFSGVSAKKSALPGYAFAKDRFWLEPPAVNVAPVGGQAMMPLATYSTTKIEEVEMNQEEHLAHVQGKLRELLEEVTGYDLGDLGESIAFQEAGLDSLLLTQIATAVDREFDVGITFRHLVEDYTCLKDLAEVVAEKVPVATRAVETAASSPTDGGAFQQGATSGFAMPSMPQSQGGSLEQLFAAQLEVMQLQLRALGNPQAGWPGSASPTSPTSVEKPSSGPADPETKEPAAKKSHSPGTRISRESQGANLSSAQKEWVDKVLHDYQDKFRSSKTYTQNHRRNFADPRTVSGFNPEWKEVIFPIATEKSKGSKLWDIDGNELIDTSNGFGPIFFGHSPDFVSEAVKKQIDLGIETGPQSPLAGEVADLFCELTGHERCTFSCSGSEAVTGALRLARTVTGRNKVVMFEGAYHGIFDEVICRPGKNSQGLPAAPGINKQATENMLVLPWGEEESLETIKGLGRELAAVLVESVQSRRPEFHSPEYIKALREITKENGAALILDEVVTGFRVHPGGICRRFDIDADLATYGKVVGGGYPIGIIGGKARFMDALDGGYWEFGDDSIPEAGVTFFAGTFVRHPLALAAARAVLTRIKEEGPALYDEMEKKTTAMTKEAKDFLAEVDCGVSFESFASFFYVAVPPEAHWGHLLFLLMTYKGIHIQQYRPNFLTTEHAEEDVAKILRAFKESVAELVVNGLLVGNGVKAKKFLEGKADIPPGARLGKNADGEPAFFIEDPENKGKYLEVGKP